LARSRCTPLISIPSALVALRTVRRKSARQEALCVNRYCLDWADLSRLIKHNKPLMPAAIFEKIRQNYRFLAEMNPKEVVLADDAYKPERKVYQNLLERLKSG
jgi:thymidylate kinase